MQGPRRHLSRCTSGIRCPHIVTVVSALVVMTTAMSDIVEQGAAVVEPSTISASTSSAASLSLTSSSLPLCTERAPCGPCEGDCRGNDDVCKPGLICYARTKRNSDVDDDDDNHEYEVVARCEESNYNDVDNYEEDWTDAGDGSPYNSSGRGRSSSSGGGNTDYYCHWPPPLMNSALLRGSGGIGGFDDGNSYRSARVSGTISVGRRTEHLGTPLTTGSAAVTVFDTTPTTTTVTTSSLPFLLTTVRDCRWDDPCGLCEGDCDGDDGACDPGLQCYERKGKEESVPGCRGSGDKEVKYCYRPDNGGNGSDGGDDSDINVVSNAAVVAKDGGTLELHYDRDCTRENPCGLCEGDCDDDNDACEFGLLCYEHRGWGQDNGVPGCTGKGERNVFYCSFYDQNLEQEQEQAQVETGDNADGESLHYTRQCDATTPCGLCEGDCDDDFGCMPGLRCYPRNWGGQVPGCDGYGESDVDYCYFSATTSTTDTTTMTSTTDTTTMTTTTQEDGLFAPATPLAGNKGEEDEQQDSSAPPLTYMFDCTAMFPCGICQGRCFDDSGCEGGLECFLRDGAEPVPGCSGSGVTGINYCYDLAAKGADERDPKTKQGQPSPTPKPSGGLLPMSTSPSPSSSFVMPSLVIPLSPAIVGLMFVFPSRRGRRSVQEVAAQTASKMAMSSTKTEASESSESESPLSLEALNMDQLTLATEGAIMESFAGVYSLFEKVEDIELTSLSDAFGGTTKVVEQSDVGLEGANTTTTYYVLHYRLIVSARFKDAPNWKLPSTDELDKMVVGTLRNEGFIDLLQQSDDPVLSLVDRVDVILLATEGNLEGGDDSIDPTESGNGTIGGGGGVNGSVAGNGNGDESGANGKIYRALLISAVVVSFAAVLACGLLVFRRYRMRSRQHQNIVKDKTMESSEGPSSQSKNNLESDQNMPPDFSGSVIISPSADESDLGSTGGWSSSIVSYGHQGGGGGGGPLFSQARSVASTPDRAGALDWSRERGMKYSKEGGDDHDRDYYDEGYSVDDDNQSLNRSIISFGTDNMSAIGMARLDRSIMEINVGYENDGASIDEETREAEENRIKFWLKKRQEMYDALNATNGEDHGQNDQGEEWLTKRKEIVGESSDC